MFSLNKSIKLAGRERIFVTSIMAWNFLGVCFLIRGTVRRILLFASSHFVRFAACRLMLFLFRPFFRLIFVGHFNIKILLTRESFLLQISHSELAPNNSIVIIGIPRYLFKSQKLKTYRWDIFNNILQNLHSIHFVHWILKVIEFIYK